MVAILWSALKVLTLLSNLGVSSGSAAETPSFWYTAVNGRRQYPPPLDKILGAAPVASGQPPDCALPGCVVLPQAAKLPALVPLLPAAPPNCTDGVSQSVGCVALPAHGESTRRLPDEPAFGPGVDGAVKFKSSTTFPGGGADTMSTALGDLNGDGFLDIVVGNSYGQANELLLGDGSGGFVASPTFPGGSADTFSINLGDLNRDGFLDIVVGNNGQANELLLGDGSGGFNASTTFSGGREETLSIALGDLNGDGFLDIVVGTGSAPTNAWGGQANELLLGDGYGGFNASTTFPGGSAKTKSIALGDLNRDGFLDIVVGNYDQANELLLGDGSGGFVASPTFPGGRMATSSIALGDLNRDGFLDIVVGNYFNEPNELLLGDGWGGFNASTTFPGGSALTQQITLGDLNCDGFLDIVVGNDNDGPGNEKGQANELLLGDGFGGFAASPTFPGGSAWTMSIALGDLDRDGFLDIVVGNAIGQANELLLGDGSGGFVASPTFPGGSAITSSIALGDLNHDGFLDIVVVGELWVLVGNAYFEQAIQLLLGDGSGGFVASPTFDGGSAATSSIALGDLNRDGFLDIVLGNGNCQANELLLGDGSGGFVASPTFPGGSANTTSINLGDLNRDGFLDITVGNNHGQANELLLGDGSGGFVASATFPGGNADTTSIALGDLNRDGFLDVVVGNSGGFIGQANELLLSDGSGGFVVSPTFPSSGSADTRSIVLGDLNGDGFLDIVVGNNMQANELLLGDGSGGFVASPTFPGGSALTSSIALGDLDRDGFLDIMVGNNGQANELLLGDGSGGFNASTTFPGSGASTMSIALGDLNLDGFLDIVMGNLYATQDNELLLYSICPAAGTARSATSLGCVTCPFPMSFRTTHSDAFCQECGVNTQRNHRSCIVDDSDECAACAVGFTRRLGTKTCVVCPVGKGTRTPGSSCTACQPGTYLNGTECLACEAGRFGAEEGLVTPECSGACPAGKHSARYAAKCTLNGKGFISVRATTGGPTLFVDQERCQGSHETTAHEGANKCICDAGYYKNAIQECETCPEHAICTGNSSTGVTLASLPIAEGFWRATTGTIVLWECDHPEYCVGSVTGVVDTVDDYCRPHHRGPQCSRCEAGYVNRAEEGCAQCTDADRSADAAMFALWVVLLLLGLALIVGLLVRWRVGKYRTIYAPEPEEQRDASVGAGDEGEAQPPSIPTRVAKRVVRFAVGITVKVKILVGLAQVVSAFGETFSNDLPGPFTRFTDHIAAIESIVVRTFSFECAVETSFYTSLVLYTLTPVALSLVILGIDRVLRLCVYRNIEYAAVREKVHSDCTTAFLVLLFLVYPSVSKKVFQSLFCVEFEDHSRALKADLSVDCDADGRAAWVAYAVLMVLVYPVGVFALYATLLYRNRAALAAGPDAANCGDFPNHLDFLVGDYTPSYYWFEAFELLRKLAQTSLVVFVLPKTASQIVLTMLLCFAAASMLAIYLPYEERSNNRLAILAQWELYFAAFGALLYGKVKVVDELPRSQHLFSVLLILVICLAPLFVLSGVLYEFYEMYVERRQNHGRQEERRDVSMAERLGQIIQIGQHGATRRFGRRRRRQPTETTPEGPTIRTSSADAPASDKTTATSRASASMSFGSVWSFLEGRRSAGGSFSSEVQLSTRASQSSLGESAPPSVSSTKTSPMNVVPPSSSEWVKVRPKTTDGVPYFHNVATGATSWERPPTAPSGDDAL